jgi:lysyl endopeptidase
MPIHPKLRYFSGLPPAALAVWVLSGCTSAAPSVTPTSVVTFTPSSATSSTTQSVLSPQSVLADPTQRARIQPKPPSETFVALLIASPADPKMLAAQPTGGQRPVGGAPLTVAQGRLLVGGQTSAELGAKLNWRAGANGALSTEIGIRAPGALALRVGLLIEALPDAATLRIFSPTGDTEHVWTGAQVKAALQSLSQAQAGVLGQFWTPQTPGEQVVVAIDIPAGIPSSAVRLSAPRVSTFFN